MGRREERVEEVEGELRRAREERTRRELEIESKGRVREGGREGGRDG